MHEQTIAKRFYVYMCICDVNVVPTPLYTTPLFIHRVLLENHDPRKPDADGGTRVPLPADWVWQFVCIVNVSGGIAIGINIQHTTHT